MHGDGSESVVFGIDVDTLLDSVYYETLRWSRRSFRMQQLEGLRRRLCFFVVGANNVYQKFAFDGFNTTTIRRPALESPISKTFRLWEESNVKDRIFPKIDR